MKTRVTMALAALALTLVSACTPEGEAAPTGGGEAPIKVTNRIDVPEVVRNNLGITFAKVERRKIAQTLRVPGRFEYTPAATRVFTATLSGVLELQVRQFEQVKEGAWLFRIHSPALRELQGELESSESAAAIARTNLEELDAEEEFVGKESNALFAKASALANAKAAVEERVVALGGAHKLWESRVATLEELSKSGASKASDVADARARMFEAAGQLAECRQTLAENKFQSIELEVESARITLARTQISARKTAAGRTSATEQARHDRLLLALASLTGFTSTQLKEEESGVPLWRRLHAIEVEASKTGIVLETPVSNGAWVEQGTPILTVVDPTQVRVRARALQADMQRIMGGQSARVLPPAGGTLALEIPLEGKIALGLSGDADERVIELFVTPEKVLGWARPGVAVEVEITLDSSDDAVLAVPVSSVVRDELQRILFRRDPNNPDKVIRIAGEFGISDGRWIEVKRDLMEGDEVVLGGVYELKLTGSGKPTGAGHFHADGTWHEGTDH